MKGLAATLFLTVLVAFFSGVVCSTTAYTQDEELEAMFDEGVNLYKRGRPDEALQAFQAVLAENPSHELAFNFWNKAGNQIFLQMLLERGEYESVAKRFIELARVGRREKEENSDRIQELVSQVVSGDQRIRTEALLALMADHGEYTVEYIYSELASDDIEARVNVMTSLARMGQEITLPLVEVLNAEETDIRRNAAAVLGNIGDVRALPALVKLAKMDENDQVRDVAANSVERIGGTDIGGYPAAAEVYLDHAEKYLNRDDAVVKPYLASRVIWKWKDGALTKTPVYAGLYSLKLAEEACYQALACEPGSFKAMTLLAAAYAAQKAEVDAARSAAAEAEEDLSDELNDAVLNLASAQRIVALAGPDALNDALNFALNGGHMLTAVEIIRVMTLAGIQGGALERALGDDSKMVRYAAAMALAEAGVHTDEVVAALISALKESAIRRVLVIDNQSDSRNALINDLNGSGYFAVGAENGATGFERAKSYPLKDLVILRVGLTDITTDKVVFELGKGHTTEIPIMLLVEEEDQEQVREIWEGKVGGFISSPVNKEVYLPELEAVMGEALNPEREQALAISMKAGGTLALFDVALLEPFLAEMVKALDKPDEVKISILDVLTRVGYPEGLENVKEIFADESASVEVRVAAANALGSMFAMQAGVPDAEVLELLAEALGSDDTNLSLAAGAALGKAVQLPDNFKDEVLVRYRIN